jgi:hypothetical protein
LAQDLILSAAQIKKTALALADQSGMKLSNAIRDKRVVDGP